ncbi:hypothetical protein FRC02_009470 [Tulasnella sp. 418]|nr:hypothetical protein FRC02_009470 [Tulasnella sp. 418]
MADDGNNNNNRGGQSLGGGASEPLPSSWNRPSSGPRVGRIGGPSSGPAPSQGRFATLGDFASGGPSRGRAVRQSDDDDDDDEPGERDEGESWFAGGERSGISVENPGRPRQAAGGLDTVRDILKKAAQGGPPPEQTEDTPSGRYFRGSGNTLGSEDIESSYVADPSASQQDEEEAETAIRELTFWRDGFSIQDGPLMKYDDPENDRILKLINSGNAPPSVLNVAIGQPVELRVSRRINEDYVPPPKKFHAFEGSGNRLGSPLPTGANVSTTSSIPGAFPSSSATPPAQANPPAAAFEVDTNKPTTNIQIRLADGTRLRSRMNLTHTVGDIRAFINSSRPDLAGTVYSIGTTFPNRTLEDNTATIESAGLQNSVIVQKLG